MAEYTLGVAEEEFAKIIWEKSPIKTVDLVSISEARFGWKKSTTYTVLKRLCNKGIFKTENMMVYAIISEQEFYSEKSNIFVNENFKGSLPAFINAFTSKRTLTEEEVKELKKIISEYE